jgi:two-component system, NarL family, invasion response regulator UvrY
MARILIVDDHTLVRQGLREILADGFAEAVFGEAGNVDEMLAHLRGSHWDVILLDIAMPGRSGLDVLVDVARLSPSTPVLILTMYPESQYALRAFRGGAAGYITKDAVAEELLKAVQVLLEGGKYLSPPVAAFLVGQITAGEGKPSHEALSGREYEVFRALVVGRSVTKIAQQLGLSSKTVSTYRVRLYEKLGVKTLVELTRYAMEHGLIDPASGYR